MSVFLDTNIVIFLVERTPDIGTAAARRVEELIAEGQRLVASDLVRMECRVRPLKLKDTTTLTEFDAYFDSEDIDVVAISAAVCDRASAIRAEYGFRPMDSLHLAAALEHGCERFLTRDLRLQGFAGINIEILS